MRTLLRATLGMAWPSPCQASSLKAWFAASGLTDSPLPSPPQPTGFQKHRSRPLSVLMGLRLRAAAGRPSPALQQAAGPWPQLSSGLQSRAEPPSEAERLGEDGPTVPTD